MNVSHHSDPARGADGAVSWVHGLHRSGCAVPSWQSPRFFSKAFLILRDPLKQIPSRARSIDDFDWLEFAGCAADFGPQESTTVTADDRLRPALKHYVLQNSFVEKYAEKSFWVEEVDAHHPATLDIIYEICKEFGSAKAHCDNVKLQQLISGALPIDEPEVKWAQLQSIDRPFAAMAQSLTRRHGKEISVNDQLPEVPWGFHCDFHSDLWSCALPPEAESLLDRSFSLEDMIRSKDTALCTKHLPPLNGSMVLSVSVARTGSETLSRILWPPFARPSMQCAHVAGAWSWACDLSDADAGDEAERSDIGQVPYGVAALQKQVFSFDEFNHSYVDALRNISDPNHRVALDVQYRPYSNNFFMPVVDFYMKGITNEELSRVSFVCTCTLKEDMDKVSKKLNLNLDTDIVSHVSVSSSDDPEVQRQWLSQRNIDWIREMFAVDEAFYLQHCSHCELGQTQAVWHGDAWAMHGGCVNTCGGWWTTGPWWCNIIPTSRKHQRQLPTVPKCNAGDFLPN
eukprot:s831_g18.t1